MIEEPDIDALDLRDFVEQQATEMFGAMSAITKFIIPLFDNHSALMGLRPSDISDFVADERNCISKFTRSQVQKYLQNIFYNTSTHKQYPLVEVWHWLAINETTGRLFDLATMINVFRETIAKAGINDNYLSLLSIRMHSFGNKLHMILQGMRELSRADVTTRVQQHKTFFALYTLISEDLEVLANLNHKGIKATSIRGSTHLWSTLQAVYDKSLEIDNCAPNMQITRNLDKLSEILFELVLNAWKYSQSAQAHSILKHANRELSNIRLNINQVGQYAVFQIKDSGIGFSEHTDPDTGRGANVQDIPGTGTGLRGIEIELIQMQGDIQILPNPGGGTIVEVRIPLSQLINASEAEV